MMTWDTALKTHRDRVQKCMSFADILLCLRKFGMPPPVEIGAGNAEWSEPNVLVCSRFNCMAGKFHFLCGQSLQQTVSDPIEIYSACEAFVAAYRRLQP